MAFNSCSNWSGPTFLPDRKQRAGQAIRKGGLIFHEGKMVNNLRFKTLPGILSFCIDDKMELSDIKTSKHIPSQLFFTAQIGSLMIWRNKHVLFTGVGVVPDIADADLAN